MGSAVIEGADLFGRGWTLLWVLKRF